MNKQKQRAKSALKTKKPQRMNKSKSLGSSQIQTKQNPKKQQNKVQIVATQNNMLKSPEGHKMKEERQLEREMERQHEAKVHKRKDTFVKPKSKNGTIIQPNSAKSVMSALDDMTVAKNFPGIHNVPYCAGMNVTPLATTCFSVANTLDQCRHLYSQAPDHEWDRPLGQDPYIVIMWCPALTAFSGFNSSPTSVAKSSKLGGLVIFQSTAATKDDKVISREIFNDVRFSRTMVQTYGSNFDNFTAGGFIWASEIDFNIVAPQANLVGTYYKGTIQYGQLSATRFANQNREAADAQEHVHDEFRKHFHPNDPNFTDANGLDVAGKLSVQDLIEISTEISSSSQTFSLRSAVVNNNLVYECQTTNTGHGLDHTAEQNQVVGELINYVVLQTPVKSITSSDTFSTFTLQTKISGNAVFFGNPQDSIANNLMKEFTHSKKLAIPSMLPNITQNPNIERPRSIGTRLMDGAKFLLKHAVQHQDAIVNLAQSIVPTLFGNKDRGPLSGPDDDAYAIKEDYKRQLVKANDSLYGLIAHNAILLKTFEPALIKLEREWYRCEHWSDSLIPCEDPDDPPSSSDCETIQNDTSKQKKTVCATVTKR